MDSIFSDKVWTSLNSASRHHADRIDCNDASQLIEYLEANVTCLKNFWSNVEENLKKIKVESGKNLRLSRALYEECRFKLENCDYEAVLNLANEAIVNCPTKQSLLFSRLYLLRSLALYKLHKYQGALVNIETAVKAHSCPEYLVYMSKCLRRLDRYTEALACLQQALASEAESKSQSNQQQELSILDQRRHQEMVKQLFNSLQKDLEGVRTESSKNENTDETREELGSTEVSPSAENEVQSCNFEIDYRCQLKEGQSVGRHFVADEVIKAGTLIFKERSYSLVVLPEAMHRKCSFCYKDVTNQFWPCTGCNELVFCDEQCAERGTKQFHRFECGLAKYFLGKSKSTFHMFRFLGRLGIDSILGLEHDCHLAMPYNIDTYINDQEQKSMPDYGKDRDTQLRAYKVKLSLVSHMDKFKPEHCPHQMVNAIDCALMACLVQGYQFDKLSRYDLLQLIDKCYVGIRRILINSFRWSETDQSSGEKFNVATCLCLIGSLFNHSCDYNAEWMFENGVIYLTTVRDIKPGEDISICYGYDKTISYEERQKQHLSYYFQCSCPPCLSDARGRLALQCRACPGPVMCNSAVYRAEWRKEAVCLLCCEPYQGTQSTLQQLSRCRQEIDLVTKLFNSGIDQSRFLEVLRQNLATVQRLAYHRSNALREDIYKVCRILAQQALLRECIHYGNLADQLIPLYGEQNQASSDDQSDWKEQITSFDQEIDETIFWIETYKRYILNNGGPFGSIGTQTQQQQQQPPVAAPPNQSDQQQRAWNVLLRFYFRLFKLIKAVISERERKAKQLQGDGEHLECGAISEDVRLLNMLYQIKKGELQSFKQTHATEQVFN